MGTPIQVPNFDLQLMEISLRIKETRLTEKEPLGKHKEKQHESH